MQDLQSPAPALGVAANDERVIKPSPPLVYAESLAVRTHTPFTICRGRTATIILQLGRVRGHAALLQVLRRRQIHSPFTIAGARYAESRPDPLPLYNLRVTASIMQPCSMSCGGVRSTPLYNCWRQICRVSPGSTPPLQSAGGERRRRRSILQFGPGLASHAYVRPGPHLAAA
jgi:hypothetical protein